MKSLISSRFVGKPTEEAGKYSEFWFWDEDCSPGSVVAATFVRYTQLENGFPLAVFKLKTPVLHHGMEYQAAIAGTKHPPTTVRRVYSWPMFITWMYPEDEDCLLKAALAQSDIATGKYGCLEPAIFEGSPHLDLRVPGSINEGMWDPLPPGVEGTMVELIEGKWWEKLEIDEKTRYVRRSGEWVPLEE